MSSGSTNGSVGSNSDLDIHYNKNGVNLLTLKSNEEKLRNIDSKDTEKEPLLFMFSYKETFDMLKTHLEYEYSAENMEFVSDVLDYETEVDVEYRKTLALSIYKNYIAKRSKKELNLPSKVREDLLFLENITDENSKKETDQQLFTVSLFEKPKLEALSMMKLNSFPRFSGKVNKLVHASWKRITEKYDAETVGKIFYKQLFKAAPRYKTLFTRDNRLQSKMFISMIDQCITIMDDLNQLIPKLAKLSIRHRAYGCHTGMFGITGQILTEVLEKAEGDHWNDELKDSWICVYTLIAVVMKQYLPDMPRTAKFADDQCTLL